MKKCPAHQIWMACTDTKHGQRFDCRVPGCDIMCWGNDTSTPADQPTRTTRMVAHAAFDGIWKSKQMNRQDAYKRLSVHLKLPLNKTHIGMFDIEMCKKVVQFADRLPLQLLKEKWN